MKSKTVQLKNVSRWITDINDLFIVVKGLLDLATLFA